MARKTTPYRVKDFPKKPVQLKKPKKSVRWADDEPKNEQRVQMFKKCPKCILVPPKKTDDKADPENYKFPICTKLGKTKGGCQFNCKGVLAANRRARLTKKYPKVVALTNKLIETWQCTKKAEKQAATQAKPKRKSVVMKPKRKVAQATKPKRKVVAPKKKASTVKPKRKVVVAKKKTTTMKPKKKAVRKTTTTTKVKKPTRKTMKKPVRKTTKTTTSKSYGKYGKPKRK